jgi:hypothetical protein
MRTAKWKSQKCSSKIAYKKQSSAPWKDVVKMCAGSKYLKDAGIVVPVTYAFNVLL